MGSGVDQAPKREHSPFRREPKKKKRDVAGRGQPSTAHATNPPKPPEDLRVANKKPDPMAAHGHLTEDKVADAAHEQTKKPATNGLPPEMKAAMDNLRAITETAVLVSTMGKVDEREGRWKFLNTLDRIDDPDVRKRVKQQFEAQTKQSLDHFIESAPWYSKRDREQAKDMVSANRDHAEEANAKAAKENPEEYAKKKEQAIKWAAVVLQTTRKDDVDHDADAKPIFDTLGPRSPEEIEMIRAEIRKQTGGRTAYQEIDKSLSGGTEDEALAGLKGDKINAVAAGIRNADGNVKRMEELLLRLSPDEIKKLNFTNPDVTIIAIQSVPGAQRQQIGDLLVGNKAHANATHIADLFKDPKDGFEMDGIMPTAQSKANLENRQPANIIKELRNMPAEDIRAARDAWNADPANKDRSWSEMIEERFKGGDSNMLLRMRALADGNKVEERAYALREGMRKQNQDMIEESLANPDLNSPDPVKKSIAISEKLELEARMMSLDAQAKRTEAQIKGQDPNAVVAESMQEQLSDYYKEYGEKVPQPKDFDSMMNLMRSGEDGVKKQRTAQAEQNNIASTELTNQGELSKVTQIQRAEKKGDLQTKAQLLENLSSTAERVEIEKEYKNRTKKDVYADPRAAEFDAMAQYKQKFLGDERPLSEIQKEVADEARNANEHRIHNVDVYGAKVERSADLEYQLQKEQFARQHSDSLEASEKMREIYGGNIGTEDLARHQLDNMNEMFVDNANPFDPTPRKLRDGVSEGEFKARDKAMTDTLELQRTEKIKHAERLAMAFSTIAKIGALLVGQPHLVFLIDAAAGLTEMAIKSSAMGNDYDPSLDQKMFGLTMAVDALTLGAGKYFQGAASKLDDVVAAEKAGANAATEIVEKAATSEAKKEIAEDAIKQVAKTEASLASGVAKSADETVEGGMAMAKTEQALAKAEGEVAETAVETSAEKAMKSLQRQEMAVNLGIGAGQTAAASQIQGENTDDMLFGIMRGMLGSLVPNIAGGKIDKMLGTGKLGSVVKAGINVASDMTIGGNDLQFALAGAAGNHMQAKKAQKAQHGEQHVMAHLAEELTYRPAMDDEPTVKKASAPVDPNVLAHGHNAEPDHLVRPVDEDHPKRPAVNEAQTKFDSADRTGASAAGALGVSDHATDHRKVQHSETVSDRANARRDKMDPETRTLHDQQFALAENPGQQALLERAVAAGRSVEDVKKLRLAMTGMSDADVVQYFSGSGLIQYYHQSCVPTAYQIALAEIDPMYALHLRNNPGEMMQKQRDVLIADGAAQTPRIEDNNKGKTYQDHANDPETARILSEESRFSDQGDKLGISVSSMKNQELHKDLEAATGTPYEIMTKRQGTNKLDSVPVDRIVQAASENKPVMYASFGHEYTIIGSEPGPDGKVILKVQDPMSGKVSKVDAETLGMMKVESVTLPGTAHQHDSGDSARNGAIAGNELSHQHPTQEQAVTSGRETDRASPTTKAAAAAIPGTEFHGNLRGKSEPDAVQAKASAAAAQHAGRFNGTATPDGGIELKLPGGAKRTVRVVAAPPETETNAPVAHYKESQLKGEGEITIYVSDQASDDHISRAVAHDLAEISHRLARGSDAEGPDLLSQTGATSGPLSGHDVGRLAELVVLAEEMKAVRGKTDPASIEAQNRLQKDADALLSHLGLDPKTPGAAERWVTIQESGVNRGADNSARLLTKGRVNPSPLEPKPDKSIYGKHVTEGQVDALGKTKHLSGEELGRLAELQAKAKSKGLDDDDKASLRILLDQDEPADVKQLEDAKQRALEVGKGADADHEALPPLPSGAVIIDSQLLIALNTPEASRDRDEAFFVQQLQGDNLHATDLSHQEDQNRHGMAPRTDLGRVPIEVARDSEQYHKMLEALVRYNVGKGGGTGDRTIVADAFFARTENGGTPTLKTADRNVINSLLRMSGRDPQRLGGGYGVLSDADGKPSFEVTINNKTLRVEIVMGLPPQPAGATSASDAAST